MARQVLKLFECCFITKGKNRSIIVDGQRDSFYVIPNTLANLFDPGNVFKECNNVDDESVENRIIIEEYKTFLIDNELGFYCDEEIAPNFKKIELKWEYPALITNAIFQVKYANFEKILNSIEDLTVNLFTRHLELFISDSITIQQLKSVLNHLNSFDLHNYNLIFSLSIPSELDAVIELLQSEHKIFRTIVYSNKRKLVLSPENNAWGTIFLLPEEFSYGSCGVTDQHHFCPNLDHYAESQSFNTCLNRKVSVGEDGSIKNCPNISSSFGNIYDIRISSIIDNDDFKKIWNITKDNILVCKDCEFRHICTDCRAFLEDPSNVYSKPLKCGYDPYTNVWNNSESHVLNHTDALNALVDEQKLQTVI